MSGILNLLNADDLISKHHQQQQQQEEQQQGVEQEDNDNISGSNTSLNSMVSLSPGLESPSTPKLNSNKPLIIPRDQIPKSKINKHLLNNKKFVKLAIRRKYSTKRNKSDTKQSKLHIKSLKAGIKVKMTLSNNLFSLYHNLIPFTDNRNFFNLFNQDDEIFNKLLNDIDTINNDNNNNNNDKNLICKNLQLINNNVVDLSEYSNKILKSFTNGNNYSIPTFNSLDTALNSLFGTKNFTLVRITRSTTDDIHGSTILKLETATPGDFNLIDDEENSDEMLHSLGKFNEVPNNLFFKKIIARPRYKSNMKIYFIPECLNYSLYTDYRMFERDLFNGIIQLEFNNDDLNDLSIKKSIGYNRNIYCTFHYHDVLRSYKKSLIESKSLPEEEEEEEEDQKQKQQQEEEEQVKLKQEEQLVSPSSQASPPPPLPPLPPQQQSQQQQQQQQHPFTARAQSMDDSLMMMPSIVPPPPRQSIGYPILDRRPSLILPNHSFQNHNHHHHQSMLPNGPPPIFNHPFGGAPPPPPPPPPQQQQQQQQQSYFQPHQYPSDNTSPSFIHVPPPPPQLPQLQHFQPQPQPQPQPQSQSQSQSQQFPPRSFPLQLPMVLPQTPRSSIVKEDVLGLLRPFNDQQQQQFQSSQQPSNQPPQQQQQQQQQS